MHPDEARQMSVRLDAAGHRNQPAGMDNPPAFNRSIVCADERNLFAIDPDCPTADPSRGYHLCAFDQKIEHNCLPLRPARLHGLKSAPALGRIHLFEGSEVARFSLLIARERGQVCA
jgi:hypothetical protein